MVIELLPLSFRIKLWNIRRVPTVDGRVGAGHVLLLLLLLLLLQKWAEGGEGDSVQGDSTCAREGDFSDSSVVSWLAWLGCLVDGVRPTTLYLNHRRKIPGRLTKR